MSGGIEPGGGPSPEVQSIESCFASIRSRRFILRSVAVRVEPRALGVIANIEELPSGWRCRHQHTRDHGRRLGLWACVSAGSPSGDCVTRFRERNPPRSRRGRRSARRSGTKPRWPATGPIRFAAGSCSWSGRGSRASWPRRRAALSADTGDAGESGWWGWHTSLERPAASSAGRPRAAGGARVMLVLSSLSPIGSFLFGGCGHGRSGSWYRPGRFTTSERSRTPRCTRPRWPKRFRFRGWARPIRPAR